MKKSTFLKSVLISIVLCLNIFNTAKAADYYWVNGTGNWSDFLGHWATTSGGAINHIQAPGANDNVFFDANSFTLPLAVVTVDVLATCNNMSWIGVTNNPNFTGFFELNVFGSLTFSPLMTTNYTGQLKFKSSNPGNTVDFSTIPLTINQIEFSGTGEWSIISNIDVEAVWGQITVAGGTVNFNNNIYKLGALQSWDMGIPRIINLGSCTMDIQWFWIMNPSSVSFNAGTSTLNFKNNWFSGNGLTYYNVNFPLSWPGDVQINDGNVFHNLGLTDPNVTGLVIEAGKIQTIYDIDFGATCANRKTIRSNTDGQTATLKKVSGSVTENYLNIKDITVIGGASFTTNNGINMGNVTNWTINASVPTTYYWVGGTGNWSESNHWALSSGAAYPSGNTCVPTDVDNVIFDVNSFSAIGQSVTLNTNAFCKNITWTGVANNPSLSSSGAGSLFVYGSLTLDPLMTYNSFFNIYFMSNIIGNTITTAGKTINSTIYFDGIGEWALQDNLQFALINHNKGTFNLNNKNITGSSYSSYTADIRTLNLGSSILTLNSSWDLYNGTNFTLNAGTSIINFSGWQFNGGSKIYNTVNLNNTSSTNIIGSNTFQTLNNSGAGDLMLTSGSTQTILTDLTSTGTCSDLIQITSTISGNAATISKASGTITLNYVTIKDIAAIGGATFNANNSIDNGNVSGVNFTALPSQNYYWIGGSGNWSNPLKWSLSSGGPANAGGCIPTQADNVFFDAASGLAGQTVTVNQNAYCNNMNWTGVSVNATFTGSSSLEVYGDFILSNMAYSFTGDLYFKATDLGNNINTAGRTLNNNTIYFSGVGEWLLQNTFTSSSSRTIYFSNGTLRTNNFNLTAGYIYSFTTNNRLLNLGSSLVTVSSWYISDGLNMSIIPGTSTLTVNSSSYFVGGGLDFNNVNIQPAGLAYIYGSNTFNTLNIPNCNGLQIENGTTQTFNNIIFPNGTGCTTFFNLSSSISGSPANFSMPAGILNKNWLSITDISAGGGATFNATNSQGIGTVTGWIITSSPSVDYYWVGNTGNWDEPIHWSLSSGGPANPSSCIPGPQDNVFFDVNSFTLTNQTTTINVTANCKNMNWTGVTNDPNLGGWMQININGSLTFSSNINLSNNWSIFNFSSSLAGNTIFTAGKTLNGILFSGSGTYTLSDNISTNWSGVQFNNGTLNTNNFNITSSNGSFGTNSSSPRILNLGSSTINVATWDAINTTGLTFNTGTSEIIINGNGWQFNGGNLTYNNVTIYPYSWTFNFNGSNTFNKLTLLPGNDILFEAGKTQNTSDFIALGTIGNEISLKSATDGVTSGINQVTQEFCGDKLIIKDMVASGNTFYAGSNSINQGNNTGWTWSGVTAIDQYPAPVCETTPGGGSVSGINLTLLQSAIDGGSGSSFSWFEDPALTVPVATPTNVTINDGTDFYAQVNDGTCSNVASVTYTVLPKPILSFVSTNVTCFGSNDGNINLTVSNGTAPYTYLWTGGLITEDIAALIAGTYNVTVTDINTCSTTSSAIVNQPAILAATIVPVNVTVCNGNNNGSITINGATGGGGTYQYSINGGLAWQASNSFTNLFTGTYDVRIRDAVATTCVITLNAALVLTQPAILSGTVSKTDATCFGASNGSITIGSSAGGGGTYGYSINGGVAWQASNIFSNIAAGTYDVRIRDAANPTCVITLNAAYVVNQPLVLSATVTPTNITICYGNNNGSIIMSAPAGGSGNYEYTINGGTNWQGSPSFTNLIAGTYNVQIRDANAITCTITLNAALVLTQPAILSATVNSTNVTCFNASDGSISITVPLGGGGTYQYSINGGTSWQASGTFNSLIAGTYNVKIRDAANPTCIITLNAALAISQPAILAATIAPVNVTVCNGNNNGSITINAATGGGGTYQYSINGGLAWQASNSFTNLFTGTYDVRIRDAVATTCVITLNAALVLTQPAILSGTVSKTDATCFGASNGSITIGSSAGGGGTYGYSINGGVAWQASNTFSNIAAGTYDVRIRDAANPTCIITLNAAYVINQPLVLSATVTPTNITICNGNNNGSIILSAPAGGSGNYEYTINGGTNWQGSPSFTNLIAGTYNVQIRDANAITCTITLNAALVLTQPAILSATVNSTNVTCFNASDGSISITAPLGGGGTYQYSINGGTSWQASGTFNSLIAGTYDVKIRDAANPTCIITLNATLAISQPAILAATIAPVNVTVCNGNNNGSITINAATGGGGTYQYSINGGLAWQASNSFTNLFTGTYDVRIRDAVATTCVITLNAALVLTQPTILSGTVSKTDATCFGASNGSITIGSSAGGGGTYGYSINGGVAWQASNTFSNIAAGTYDVRIRDAANPTCVITLNAAFVINQPLVLSATVTPTNITICYGNNNGSIIMSAPAGGSGNYEYTINGGTNWQGSPSFTNLIAGTYNVQIRDANAITCTITLNAALVLTQPAILSATVNSTNVTCFNASDGSISITAPLGGGGTYQYSINGGTSWQASGTFNSLIAGTYNVKIRDAANPTCVITLNAALAINQPAILAATTSVINVSCNGGNNGSISINGATGGSGTYQYSINGGTSWQASGSFTNLSAGTYDIRIRDANATTCVITINSVLVISQPSALVASSSATQILCYAQSATVTVSAIGGTLPYSGDGTFTVWAGTHNYTVTDANSCTSNTSVVVTEPSELVATSNDAAILCNGGNATVIVSATGGTLPYSGIDTFIVTAGTHFYTVTDANACTSSTSATVTEPDSLIASSSSTSILCNGGNSTITVVATGGTLPYSGEGTFTVTAGTHSYTVTDANACTSNTSVIVSEPDALVASSSATQILCYAQSATVTVSAIGGTLPYSGDGTFTVWAGTHNYTVTDANSCTSNTSVVVTEPSELVATSNDAAILCNGGNATVIVSATGGTLPYLGIDTFIVTAGTHFYTVTDANACTSSTSATVTEPDSLIASSSSTSILCNGGNSTITVVATGGTLPYSGEGTFTVTAGTHNYTVTDANTCTSNISVIISEPDALVASSSATEVLCYAQSSTVTVSATGGTLPYSGDGTFTVWAGIHNYTITDANSCTSNTSVTVSEPTELVASSSETAILCNGGNSTVTVSAVGGTIPYTGTGIFTVIAGTYFYTVTDDNACASSTSATISEPAILSITAVQTNVSVSGGSDGAVDITVTGGDSNYSYAWSNTATTEDLSGLTAGSYSVTVTDGNLCIKTNTSLITQPSAPSCDLAINATVLSNVLCNGANNGIADVEITDDSNPVTPYIFSWQDISTNVISNNDTVNSLAPGQYIVVVMNNDLSCTTIDTIQITEPDALTLSLSSVNISCFGDANGSITAVSGGGGTGAHYYNWSNTETTSTISNLSAGWYILTVSDANNCTIIDSVEITQPEIVDLFITGSNITCNGLNDGTATASATGGDGIYSYIWSNNETTSAINGLNTGWYYVTVNDSNNCNETDSVEIAQPEILAVSLNTSMISCASANNGMITATVSGGTTAYSYYWNNGSVTDTINNLSTGNYIVTITDANNCEIVDSIVITEPDVLSGILSANIILCNGETTDVTTTVTGGTLPYSYLWDGGETSESLTNVAANTFIVTITDANGCIVTDTLIVTEPDALLLNAAISNVICNGQNNGNIAMTITGDTLPINILWSTGETTESISSLIAGFYNIVITDANGCITNNTYFVSEPDAIVISESVTNVSSFGGNDGAVDITVTGGDLNYLFVWSDTNTTEDLSGLFAGTYSLTVTDGNLCSSSHTSLVTQPSNPSCVLDIEASVLSNATCYGGNDGVITVSIINDSNPMLPYSFFWTDQNNNNISINNTVNSLESGQYFVVVMNSDLSCTEYDTIIVTEPDQLVLNLSPVANNCYGDSTGLITSSVTGGTSSYYYLWSTIETTDFIDNLSAGWYALTVTDMNNCIAIDSVEITEPTQLELSLTSFNATCFGLNNGSAVAEVSGGVASYLFNWSNSETTDTVGNLFANWYTVTATDANLCMVIDSIEILEPNEITIDTITIPASSGTAADGSIFTTVSGGTSPYSYIWSNGSVIDDPINVTTGIYDLTVTDTNGCIANTSVFVDFIDALSKTVAEGLGFSIYPNPTSRILNITGSNEASITLYDVTGKVIYNSIHNSVITTIDVSTITDGTYLLKIISDNKVINSKIIVRK